MRFLSGGFDYVTIDSAARRLYLSHGNQVDVVDPDNDRLIGTIADTPGVRGIALATEFKHGFTSNGRDKVSMFDPTTLQLINKIAVGKGRIGICYDRDTKRILWDTELANTFTVSITASAVSRMRIHLDGRPSLRNSIAALANMELP